MSPFNHDTSLILSASYFSHWTVVNIEETKSFVSRHGIHAFFNTFLFCRHKQNLNLSGSREVSLVLREFITVPRAPEKEDLDARELLRRADSAGPVSPTCFDV